MPMLSRIVFICGLVAVTAAMPTAVSVAVADPGSAPALTAPGPLSGRIAYVSDASGKAEIWVSNLADGRARRLIASPTRDFQPVWSPDGTQIAFGRKDANSAYTDIWVAWADGSHQRRVTTDPDIDVDPAWSPDGKQIAYTRGEGAAARVWVTTLATGVARNASPDYETREPAWRPGTDSITVSAHPSSSGGHYQLVQIWPSDRSAGPFEADPGADLRHPAWSLDGHQVATEVVTVTPDPFSVNHDVRVLDPLSGTTLYEWAGAEPVWSPDGGAVAYTNEESDGPLDVTARRLSTPQMRIGLTPYGDANEYQPSWQRPPRIVCPRPALKGTAKVGKRLRISQNRLSPALTRGSFAWFRGSKLIKGETGRFHRLTRKDAGKRVKVRVTCSVAGATTPVVVTSPSRKVRR